MICSETVKLRHLTFVFVMTLLVMSLLISSNDISSMSLLEMMVLFKARE